MKVLRSVNNADGSLCVDIFLRDDGTFGFEQYRRDAEDPRGWYPISDLNGIVFIDEEAANTAAIEAISWFNGS
jgi:hypothetical protein